MDNDVKENKKSIHCHKGRKQRHESQLNQNDSVKRTGYISHIKENHSKAQFQHDDASETLKKQQVENKALDILLN